MQHAVALQIADEFAAAAQKTQIFDPLDRAADVAVRPDHGLSALPVGGARFEHGLDDRDVAGAAAQIARQRRADAVGVRLRFLRQKGMRGHQHAGRAEAALQRVMLAEGGLQRAQRVVVRETLDGDDAAAFGLHRQHQTGADRSPVDNDRARAADAVLAAEMRAGEPQFLPQAIGEMHPRLDIDRHGLAVEPELHPHHALPFPAAARKARSTRVATRPRRYAASACRSSGGSTSCCRRRRRSADQSVVQRVTVQQRLDLAQPLRPMACADHADMGVADCRRRRPRHRTGECRRGRNRPRAARILGMPSADPLASTAGAVP